MREDKPLGLWGYLWHNYPAATGAAVGAIIISTVAIASQFGEYVNLREQVAPQVRQEQQYAEFECRQGLKSLPDSDRLRSECDLFNLKQNILFFNYINFS